MSEALMHAFFDRCRAAREFDEILRESRRLAQVAEGALAGMSSRNPARKQMSVALGLAMRLAGIADQSASALDAASLAVWPHWTTRAMHPEDIGLTPDGRMPNVDF